MSTLSPGTPSRTPALLRTVVLAVITPLMGDAAASISVVGETKEAVARRIWENVLFPQIAARDGVDAATLTHFRRRVQATPVAVVAEAAAYLALDVTYATHGVVPALNATSDIFEYIFTVRVLLDRDGYDPDSLADIGREIYDGGGVGSWECSSARQLTYAEALAACAEVGSEVGFFDRCDTCGRNDEGCIC